MTIDRWTQHARRCPLNAVSVGALPDEAAQYLSCRCPRGWPRPAVWWKGRMITGAAKVAAVLSVAKRERHDE